MSTAEKLYEVVKSLPERVQVELLDYAEYLKFKKLGSSPKKYDFSDLSGSISWDIDPLAYQKELRNEWK